MRRTLAWALATVVLVRVGAVQAVTHRVPADFATIHEALAACAAGDTVRVAPGVWNATTTRTLQIDGVPTTYVAAGFVPRDVTLLSEGGADVTSIEVAEAGTNVRCLVTDPAGGTGVARIEGFTFRRTVSRGPAIVAHGTETSRLDVRDCNFLELHGETGPGGILVAKGSLTVVSATFDACSSLVVAGAIAHADTVAASASRVIDLTDCRFTRCYKGCVGGKRVELRMAGCEFASNRGPCVRGGSAVLEVDACRFEDNIGFQDYAGPGYTVLFWDTSGSGHIRGCTLIHNGWSGLYGGSTIALVGFVGDISQNTFFDNRGFGGGAACLALTGSSTPAVVRKNIFARSRGRPAVTNDSPIPVLESCNVYWDNTSGDTSGVTRSPTSFTADPQFCDAGARDLTVHASSPCAPEYSVGCGLIGALGVGCDAYPHLVLTEPIGLNVLVDSVAVRTPFGANWAPGEQHTLRAITPQDNGDTRSWLFTMWSDGSTDTTRTVVPPAGSASWSARYVDAPDPEITIRTLPPPNLQVRVDGALLTAPQVRYWAGGTVHTLEARVPAAPTFDGRWLFGSWSQGGDRAQTYIVPATGLSFDLAATYAFEEYPLLTVTSDPPGRTVVMGSVGTFVTPYTRRMRPGFNTTVSVATVQTADFGGTEYRFREWSDGGAASHQFVLPSAPTTLTVYFDTVVHDGVILRTSPVNVVLQLDAVALTTPTFVPLTPGSDHDVVAPSFHSTAVEGYSFLAWNDGSTDTARTFTQPQGHATFTADYVPVDAITIRTDPAGLSIRADGIWQPTPFALPLAVGAAHVLEAAALVPVGDARYRFRTWSDGYTVRARVLTVPPGTELTAIYDMTYELTMEVAEPFGTVLPGTSYVPPGVPLEIRAIPETRYVLREWVGGGSGSYTGVANPATITPAGPITEVAHFSRTSYEFALSLSRDNPDVHTGAALGVGPVYLWYVCGGGDGLFTLDTGLEGTMNVLGFAPEPDVLNQGAGPDLQLVVPSCAETARLLGTWIISDASGGTLCLAPSIATGHLQATDCAPVGLVYAWPEDMRVQGVSTGAEPFCDTGRGCTAGVNPVAVRVSSFAAVERDGGVDVRWTTESPDAAFQVLRKNGEESAYRPLHPSPLQGQSAYFYRDASVLPGGRYGYMLSATETDGTETRIGPVLVTMKALPERFSFGAVEPNPILDHAVLRFATTRPGRVRVDAFDVAGRRVATVMDGILPAGEHTAAWDGRGANGRRLAAGVYFLRLQAAERTETRRVVVLGD